MVRIIIEYIIIIIGIIRWSRDTILCEILRKNGKLCTIQFNIILYAGMTDGVEVGMAMAGLVEV